MAVGRISGPLLKENLLRDGVNLAFENDLLYLDVNNGRVGIKASTPAGDLTHDLTVNGDARTTNLEVTTQADIATFTILNDTISSTSGTINLTPSGTSPVVYQGKLVVGDMQIATNVIETTTPNTDLEIRTIGTGKVNVNADMYVTGNIHATGNITADGDIQIGDANTDNIVFNADINSNLVPEVWKAGDAGIGGNAPGDAKWSLGSVTQHWKTSYINDILADSITANSAYIGGIDLALPQGNIYYVSVNGNDTNSGTHEHDPFLTVKHALSTATAGSTVYIYPGTYTEVFPLTVPAGVSVKGAGLRAVKIVPTTETRYNDAFLLNGETTVEDLAVADYFSGGNFYTVTAASAGSTTVNVGTAPFAHAYVNGGTIKIGASTYNITNAVYTHTTGVVVLTHTGGTASLGDSVFVSNLTFSCNGSTRVFPDNGYGFRFADNFTVTLRSPYVRNVTVITKGSTTSVSDPYGFDTADAGKGAYLDGAYANVASKEASMLFHSATFITPGVDTITAKNGVRVEWLNSFTYFANKGIYAFASNYGFARQGKTRLRINSRSGTWSAGSTVSYYDTNGTTLLASGVIDSVDGDYVNLTGRCLGFETITDRATKTTYPQGDAKLSTAQKKFGVSSLALDGTGDYASLTTQPDFEFGTGDFCLETWVYPTTTGVYRTLFDLRSTAGDTGGIILGISDINALYFYYNGNYRIGPVGSVTQNAWSHIALARVAGETRAFINGTQVGLTYTDTNNYAQRGVRIGADPNGNYAFAGYMDDLRISKGAGRYSTTFTAPTSALTGDLDTVLLLHFNGNNNSTIFLDDGITLQDLRVTSGGPTVGTASLINFADYSDFGAEIRSIGSANIYGNYGVYGDGIGVIAYLISQNFAYVGAGKKSTNDPNDRIAANEVTELNNAHIYYTSVDNEGNFSVGNNFYVNQKTGEVLFDNQNVSITSLQGVTFTDGVHTTIITAEDITTGNIRIHDNNVDSTTGNINVSAASGVINLQNNTYVTGNLDVTGDVTIGGNIQIGDQTTDTINFVGAINSHLIPATTSLYDIGTSLLRWNTAYLSRAEIDGLVIDSNTISTTLGNDDLSLVANGTGRIYIPSNNVQLDKNLTVGQNLTVTTGTTYLKGTSITGTLTQTGNLNQTGNFTTSGNTEVTGNITATGYLRLPQIEISGNTVTTRTAGTDLNLEANGTGNVVVEGIKFSDNNIQSVATNSDITLTPQGTGKVVVNTTQSLVIPVGTTAERPATGTESNGMIRYNTTLGQYEGWNGTYWLKLSGVQDLDGNTYIKAEATPGANDNTLYFYADNNLMVTIDSTKLFAERFQTNNLDIDNNTISSIVADTDINLTTSGTGGVKIGNLRVRNNTITNVVSGAITEFAENGTGYVRIAGTNGVVIPAGDTVTDRPPVPELGMMRFNTERQLVEVFNGIIWASVGGINTGVTSTQATDLGIITALMLG